MFVLYLVKSSNDFYFWPHGTSGPRDTVSVPDLCSPKIVLAWIPWTIKSVASCRSVSTFLIWSGAWLLHGLVCSSMSLTRQSTSGADGRAPVWELLGDISNIWRDNMNSLLTYYCYRYLTASLPDVKVEFLCGDFIFDTASLLYVAKSLLVFTRYSTNI